MNFIHRYLPGLAGLGLVWAAGAALADPLDAGFQQPPDSARPETWWHWMNGNLTREGLGADLQAMKDIGLGGATIVNVDCGIPRGNVPFMSPEWRGLFKYTVQEANRLGLELCIENCAGWSSSGGPWNTPENAMQKLVTSEVHVNGPADYDATWPSPPVTLNTYHENPKACACRKSTTAPNRSRSMTLPTAPPATVLSIMKGAKALTSTAAVRRTTTPPSGHTGESGVGREPSSV